MRPTTIVTALAIMGFAATSAIAQQAPQGAQGQRQGQNSAFCLSKSDGSKNCGYSTMAQCDAAKKGEQNATCAANTATTGSGASNISNSPSQPGSNQMPSNTSGPKGSAQPK